MILRRCIFFIFLGLLITILTINFYFLKIINSSELNTKNTSLNSQSNYFNSKILIVELVQENINKTIKVLPPRYFKRNENYINILEKIILELQIIQNANNNTLDVLKTVCIIK
jgi:hypothetical protein